VEWITNPEVWSALAALLLLEVVLGVDNVIFISILASKLPEDQQDKARRTGLLAAAGMRVLLLFGVGWVIGLKAELFELWGRSFSGKSLILLAGGLFLIYKATKEIHDKLEGQEHHVSEKVAPTFASVIVQVLILDAVFSIDSVITAVGMTDYVGVMVAAVLVSVVIMLVASRAIYTFVNQHPTVKMLALSFLLLIGVTLVAEGLGEKIPKGYIYAAIAFAVLVEMLNIRVATRRRVAVEPVHLHQSLIPDPGDPDPAASR
jgi:predicted tellurium resistance membrane protein TerC